MPSARQVADQHGDHVRRIEKLRGQFRVEWPAAISVRIPQRKVAVAKALGHEFGQRHVVIPQVPGDDERRRLEKDLVKKRERLQQQNSIRPEDGLQSWFPELLGASHWEISLLRGTDRKRGVPINGACGAADSNGPPSPRGPERLCAWFGWRRKSPLAQPCRSTRLCAPRFTQPRVRA